MNAPVYDLEAVEALAQGHHGCIDDRDSLAGPAGMLQTGSRLISPGWNRKTR